MVNLTSCEKHPECVVVYENTFGCPVCKMIGEIAGIVYSINDDSDKEKLDEIKEKISR
jgi:hypothetical protein